MVVARQQYSERDARDLTLKLLKAVASLHRVGIAHRDIKPQNLLLTTKDNVTDIKLADFGFARRVLYPESLTSRVGTPTYVSPQVLKNHPHDERVDLWSIGVVVYVLLVGYPPFIDEDQNELFRKIRNGEWKFEPGDWIYISNEAMDFIRGLLVVDPKDRFTVDEALRSNWIRQDPNQLSNVDLTNSIRIMRTRRGILRGLAKVFMLTGMDSTQIKGVVPATQAQEATSRDPSRNPSFRSNATDHTVHSTVKAPPKKTTQSQNCKASPNDILSASAASDVVKELDNIFS